MPLTAIVTGAASGIGEEACRDLLAKGWTVFGIDISAEALSQHSGNTAGGSFHAFPCDIRDADAVAATFAAISAQTSQVNAVVASAGVVRIGSLAEMAISDFDDVFSINVRGLWLTCRHAYPLLKAAAASGELARTVLLSSISAIRPKIESGAYSASKAAVSQLTQVLAVEWAGDGILVNALAPGTVDTPMIRNQSDPAKQGNWRPSGNSPLGRVAEARDVVKAMRFLLSEDADYVTGTIIPVDGGTRAAYVPPR